MNAEPADPALGSGAMSVVDVLCVSYRTGPMAARVCRRLAIGGATVQLWDNSGDVDVRDVGGETTLHRSINLLFAEPNNRMFRASGHPYVLLLNPDVDLHAQQLQRLVEELEAHPDAWGAAPRLVGVGGADQNYLRSLPTLASAAVDRLPLLRALFPGAHRHYWLLDQDRGRDGVVEQPAAACLLLRRESMSEPLFDEQFRLFFNDTDLARRQNKRGACRYVGTLAVTHVGGASLEQADRHEIRREYDEAMLRYLRLAVPGWWLLLPLFSARRLARLLDPRGWLPAWR